MGKKCKRCGKDYTPRQAHFSGVVVEFGAGCCPDCETIERQEEDERIIQAEKDSIAKKREQWRRTCGIQIRFQTARFEYFDKRVDVSILRVYKDLMEYAKTFSVANPRDNKSYVVISTWGLGKTFLASAVAHAILDKVDVNTNRCPVYVVTEPDLFRRIRACYNKTDFGEKHETEEDVFKQLTSVPLLVLDDVGKEEVSDPRFVQRVLFGLIDGRYQRMLPMIITANGDLDGLNAHMGGDRGNCAAFDRLTEMTGNLFHEMKGQSYRDLSKRPKG